MLAAVCRGKLCEGVDFTDRQCRGVVVAGMPYPSLYDKKVTLKREFMDVSSKGIKGAVNGQMWYLQEMIRAVNQTIGRVIRHSKDYGAVLFADERFKNPSQLSEVSAWIRPSVNVYEQFPGCLDAIRNFFKNIPEDIRKEGEKRAEAAQKASLAAMDAAASWHGDIGLEGAQRILDPFHVATAGTKLGIEEVYVPQVENHLSIEEVRARQARDEAERQKNMENLVGSIADDPYWNNELCFDDYGIIVDNNESCNKCLNASIRMEMLGCSEQMRIDHCNKVWQ